MWGWAADRPRHVRAMWGRDQGEVGPDEQDPFRPEAKDGFPFRWDLQGDATREILLEVIHRCRCLHGGYMEPTPSWGEREAPQADPKSGLYHLSRENFLILRKHHMWRIMNHCTTRKSRFGSREMMMSPYCGDQHPKYPSFVFLFITFYCHPYSCKCIYTCGRATRGQRPRFVSPTMIMSVPRSSPLHKADL
ncbi:hypothetical protein J6590_015911 [Homalodisca vitripennis]|nr:hypothetical protein J6590_015911 [Homalodisca vitripennis]